MRDVVYLLIVVAFFTLCVGYVGLCDRIIGPDPADLSNPQHNTVGDPSLEVPS